MTRFLITYEYRADEYLLAREILDSTGLRKKVTGSASRGVDLMFDSYKEAAFAKMRLEFHSALWLSWHSVKHWSKTLP